jgi:transposase-like protein
MSVRSRKRIRHSNFIERTFGETRRRVKVIGRLPGETAGLSLVWAVSTEHPAAGAA